MTKDEALKLALEALEGVLDDAPKVLDASIAGGLYEVVQCRDAITAIKEALAQPEERNFCQRCGKRTADLITVHTCTPPVAAGPKAFHGFPGGPVSTPTAGAKFATAGETAPNETT